MADLPACCVTDYIEPYEKGGLVVSNVDCEFVQLEEEGSAFVAELLVAADESGLPDCAVGFLRVYVAVVAIVNFVEVILSGGEFIDLVSEFRGKLQEWKWACANVSVISFLLKARHSLADSTYCSSSKACMRSAIAAFVPEPKRLRSLSLRLSSTLR